MTQRMVTIPIQQEEMVILEKICKALNSDLNDILREALSIGIKKIRVEKAIELYVRGKASLWGAAELAGLDYRSFAEELRKRGIKIRYLEEKL